MLPCFQARNLFILGPLFNWVIIGVDVGPDHLLPYIEFEDHVVFIDTRQRLRKNIANPSISDKWVTHVIFNLYVKYIYHCVHGIHKINDKHNFVL